MVYHRIPCFKRFRNLYIHGWLATHAKTTKRNASKKHLRKRQPTTCRRLCSTFAVKDLWGRQFTVVALLSDLLAGHQVPGLGHHWLCSGGHFQFHSSLELESQPVLNELKMVISTHFPFLKIWFIMVLKRNQLKSAWL